MYVVENEGGTTIEAGGELSRVAMPKVAVEDIDMVKDDNSGDDSAKDVHLMTVKRRGPRG
ncbi:ABC transporter ATP-binding protein [Sesbania bispinosa]|nr:ABC transporter ATP-binding protein [Sesbania bispinosa]